MQGPLPEPEPFSWKKFLQQQLLQLAVIIIAALYLKYFHKFDPPDSGAGAGRPAAVDVGISDRSASITGLEAESEL